MPKRIQRRRTKGWKMPAGTIYVGRRSRFGNPFIIGEYAGYRFTNQGALHKDSSLRTIDDATQATIFFKAWIKSEHGKKMRCDAIVSLRGKDLACWCNLNSSCHADILLGIANG